MEITREIGKLVREYNKSPYEINNGECEDFAMNIIERMGGYSDELTDNATPDMGLPGHYWIEYKGVCYDAECSSGVLGWQNLPIFLRCKINQ